MAEMTSSKSSMMKLEGKHNFVQWNFSLRAWASASKSLGILTGTELLPVLARESEEAAAASQLAIDSFNDRNSALYWQMVNTQTLVTLAIIQSDETSLANVIYNLLRAEFASTSEHAIHQMVEQLVGWQQNGRELTAGVAEIEKLKVDLKAAVLKQGKDIFDILALYGLFKGVDSHLTMTADMARMTEKGWEEAKAIMKDADGRLRGKSGVDPLGAFKTAVPPPVGKSLMEIEIRSVHAMYLIVRIQKDMPEPRVT